MDDRDESTKVAMILVSLIVSAVVAFVLFIGAGSGKKSAPRASQSAAAVGEAPAPVGEALLKAYYEIGKAELSADSAAALKAVVDAAVANPTRIILISGFHDASGDPAQNAELARNRALGAQSALVAAGIPAERIMLRKPEVTEGSGGAREARRVEFRVQ